MTASDTGPAVYLDHNATSVVRPEAKAAVAAALDTVGNPSSTHGFGRAARKLVEEAREQVAALAGASPAQVYFTSGGTEANAIVLRGCPGRDVIVTEVEHPAVLNNAFDGTIVPVDGEGVIDLDALDAAVAESGPALVSVMTANNETGVIQPLDAVRARLDGRDVWLHTDAVQAAGKVDLAPVWAVADMMTLSAHKLGGPQGVGALILGDGVEVAPLWRGGGQERRQRSGTENLPGIAGFGAAAAAALRDLEHAKAIEAMRDRLEREARVLANDIAINGGGAPRLPNTSNLSVPGMAADTLMMSFDLAGVAVSAGSACSSGKVTVSHVLAAMGVGDDAARAAIRVSLGWTTREADIDRFVSVLGDLCARRRAA
jgi:cysteine desulfurase